MIGKLVYLRSIPCFGKIIFYFLKFLGLEIPLQVIIGKNVIFEHWAQGSVIHENCIIEDNVRIFQGVSIGRANAYKSMSEKWGILIKDGAVLCAGSKILCKKGILTVGKNTVIGANAVLLTSTGDNEIWAGIPAKKVGDRN